jgi:hypothetical protein
MYGDVHIHNWDAEMDSNAREIVAARITSPALASGSGILFTAASACSNLRSLRLDNVKCEALSDLQYLSKTLEKLTVRVLWPKLPEGYSLDQPTALGRFAWARGLENLKYLDINTANTPTCIGIKEITGSLPSKNLASLRLWKTVAPCNLTAADFSRFSKLEFLSIRECHFATPEIRELQKVLPHLYGIECIQRSSKDAHRLLRGHNEPSEETTCRLSHLHLCLHFSSEEFSKFVKPRLGTRSPEKFFQLSPKMKSINVSFSGSPSCILAAYYSHPSQHPCPPVLDSLAISSSLDSFENAAWDGSLSSLRSLSLKPHHLLQRIRNMPPADCRNFPGLSSMHHLTELDLSFRHIKGGHEDGVSSILDNMRNLKRLRLDSIKGSTHALGAIVKMKDLHTLKLNNCQLIDLCALKFILKGRGASLHEFYYICRECHGGSNCIFKVVAGAVPDMPRLKILHFHEPAEHRSCSKESDSSLHLLPQALAKCTSLTEIHLAPVFIQPEAAAVDGGFSYTLPNWKPLTSLTRLRKLAVDTKSGWTFGSLSEVCRSLIHLQDLSITDYQELDDSVVVSDWLVEVARLPLLNYLSLLGCRSLKLPHDLKPLEKAPSLMFLGIIGMRVQHPYAMADEIQAVLPNIQKCNVHR